MDCFWRCAVGAAVEGFGVDTVLVVDLFVLLLDYVVIFTFSTLLHDLYINIPACRQKAFNVVGAS